MAHFVTTSLTKEPARDKNFREFHLPTSSPHDQVIVRYCHPDPALMHQLSTFPPNRSSSATDTS